LLARHLLSLCGLAPKKNILKVKNDIFLSCSCLACLFCLQLSLPKN